MNENETIIKYFKYRHTRRTGKVQRVTYRKTQYDTLKPIKNDIVTLSMSDIHNMKFEN